MSPDVMTWLLTRTFTSLAAKATSLLGTAKLAIMRAAAPNSRARIGVFPENINYPFPKVCLFGMRHIGTPLAQ